MEALLLSAAKGYSKADAVRFNLPALESWYGLSLMLKDRKLSEEDITCKKNRCEGRFPPLCRLQFFLEDEVFSLFCLIPWDPQNDFHSFHHASGTTVPRAGRMGNRSKQTEIRSGCSS